MSALHAYFLLRNQQAFQRLLDASIRAQPASTAAPLSSSGGKSWNRPSPLSSSSSVPPCDVNARDWLGRTVLHLAVASAEPAAVEYVRLLLTHPRIDVNLADTESRWTALHRALYVGNLTVCVFLLQRSDIDTSLKDYEGYTAFDVYNSTVEGTKPEDSDATDLFTWGANRNAALGLGDGDDRIFPEQLVIEPSKVLRDMENSSLSERFSPIRVKQVAMSKLHTAVITSEDKSGNLRVCGFGSGGRLGLGQHTQYSLVPIAQLQHIVTAVALGQDHTLALTKGGDVLSWGLNRFSQLGYVIEPASSGVLHRNFANADEPIQAVPRRIYGPLKKEIVRGVAACKTASACWTDEELFTWGTNSGQLGYDKNAQPVQILPRKVTPLTQPVIDVAMTDAAMACLLESKDVVCFWNGKNFKINFPTQSFPSEIQAYRPPMALNNASIAKVVSCDYTFSALSRNGEMFTFSLNPPSAASEALQGKAGQGVKPQRVWALRKQFSAVKDVALGADGSIILCTESGHVYVRSRNTKGGQTAGAKTFKFQRMPFLQRVIRVSANSTGAFGVLRSDCKPKAIEIIGNLLFQDFACIQPFLTFDSPEGIQRAVGRHVVLETTRDGDDDDGDDSSILQDVKLVMDFCDLLLADENLRQDSRYLFANAENRHGADLLVVSESGFQVPVHRVILASRSTVLCKSFRGESLEDGSLVVQFSSRRSAEQDMEKVYFPGAHPLTILILLHYLYTDGLLAVWDRRIDSALENHFSNLAVSSSQIRSQLRRLSKSLRLQPLSVSLEAHTKRPPPPSLSTDMQSLLDLVQDASKLATASMPSNPLMPNVILELSDKNVHCHSVILRARSPFFAGLFDDEDWTTKRWQPDRSISVNLKHMKWRAFSFVIRYIYCGGDKELFDVLDFVQNVDDVLEFMFEVMDIASELLLDRLGLICSAVILQHITISNVCSVLTDATHYSAGQLVASLQGYMARNLETLMESRMLDDLSPYVVRQLSTFVQSQQEKKLPLTRSTTMLDRAIEAHGDWLALQDIPQPIVRAVTKGSLRQSPRLSPVALGGKRSGRHPYGPPSPSTSPRIVPRQEPTASTASGRTVEPTMTGDEVFMMDDETHEDIPPISLSSPDSGPTVIQPVSFTAISPWKTKVSHANARSDLRSIMAEAESQRDGRPSLNPSPVRPQATGSDTSQLPATPKLVQKTLVPETIRSKTDLPWRTPTSVQVSLGSSLFTPQTPPRTPGPSNLPNTSRPGVNRQTTDSPSASPSRPIMTTQTQTTPSSKNKGSLGPVFAPTKQAVGMSRRTSDSNSAWTTAPPIPPASEAGPSSSPPSFVAIQQQQRETVPTKMKKSLREIQEEEEARQAEEDFMKWWTAEEERIRSETQSNPPSQDTAGKRTKSTRKAPFKGAMAKGKQESTPGEQKPSRPRTRKRHSSHLPKEL